MEEQKNKYKKHKKEYTISVKYFTKSVPYPLYNQNGDVLEPIYIRIICKRQSTTIKSRLNGIVREEDLPAYMADPIVSEFANRETAAIIASIKLMKPDQNPDFKISNWQKHYDRGYDTVFSCCFLVIMHRLSTRLQQIGIPREELDAFDPSSVQALKLLVSLGVPAAKELYEQYYEIFNLNEYEKKSRDLYGYYQYSLWDYISGNYQSMLRRILSTDSEYVIRLIGDLVTDYPTVPFPHW